jgi:hypothetical protein
MERLEGSLRGVLRGVGVPDAGVLADVTRAWPGVVGDAIARAAWPRRIAGDGTLLVAACSSTWAFELGLLGEEILAKLRGAVGEGAPSAIRFTPGEVPSPPAPAADAAIPAPPEIDATTRILADELTAAMTDVELRATIARAAAASLSKAAADRRF